MECKKWPARNSMPTALRVALLGLTGWNSLFNCIVSNSCAWILGGGCVPVFLWLFCPASQRIYRQCSVWGRLEMSMCMKMRDRERERKKNLQWRGINVHSFTGDQFTECPAHRGLVEKSHKSSGQSFCRIFASFPVIFPFRSGSGTHTYTYTPTKKKPFPPQIRSDLARKFCVWKTGSGWNVPCFFFAAKLPVLVQ